jgi:hypothetical protein
MFLAGNLRKFPAAWSKQKKTVKQSRIQRIRTLPDDPFFLPTVLASIFHREGFDPFHSDTNDTYFVVGHAVIDIEDVSGASAGFFEISAAFPTGREDNVVDDAFFFGFGTGPENRLL